MPSEDFDRYVSTIAARMPSYGHVARPDLSQLTSADAVFHKREFSASKFGMLDTFWCLAYVAESLSPSRVQTFGSEMFAMALRHKHWLPRGFGGTAGCFPVLVADQIDAATRTFVRGYCPKHWASFEFPVLIELSTGQVGFYDQTPMWGAAYYAGFRQQATLMLSSG